MDNQESTVNSIGLISIGGFLIFIVLGWLLNGLELYGQGEGIGFVYLVGVLFGLIVLYGYFAGRLVGLVGGIVVLAVASAEILITSSQFTKAWENAGVVLIFLLVAGYLLTKQGVFRDVST